MASTLHTGFDMRSATTLVIPFIGLLALGLSACRQDDTRDPELTAPAEEDEPRASADRSRQDEADDDRYRADAISRTGVRIDRELATACSLGDTEAFFAFDSTVLTSRAHDVLARVAECITDGPLQGKELELVGYADPRGADEYNKELGLMRAESVAKCLRDHGVGLTQIEINSLGEKKASDDASEWPLDRRVDIRIKG